MGLRDKFKPVKTDQLKKNITNEAKFTGDSSRSGYLQIEEGPNKFRLFPPHPGHESFSQLTVKHWVGVEKDGQMRRAPVPNSRIHGGLKHDIFEEYIRRSKAWMEENDVEDSAEKVKVMTAWKGGITGSTNWLMYALKIDGEERTFGLLEVGKAVRDGINAIATSEDEDDPIEVDPFTHPDTGLPFTVTYKSKAQNPKDKYLVSLGRKPVALPLTDEELEDFETKKPLSEIMSFSDNDLETAIEGLKKFDEENEIGFCATDEFEALVEEIKAEMSGGKKSVKKTAGGSSKPAPTKKEKKEEPKKPLKKSKPQEDEEEAEEEEEEVEEEADEEEEELSGDHLTALTRDALKKYIAKKSLEVKVKTSMSDEDIREAIRAVESPAEEEEAEEEEDDDSEADLASIKASLKKKAGR